MEVKELKYKNFTLVDPFAKKSKNKTKSSIFSPSITLSNFTNFETSPCPWADWLKCEPLSVKGVNEIYKSIQEYNKLQNGGDHYGGSINQEKKEKEQVNRYIKKLDIAIKIANNLQTQIKKDKENLKMNRIKAAAALNYIIRLFSLNLEDNLDVIRRHVKQKYNRDLSNVMGNMAQYIKDTRTE